MHNKNKTSDCPYYEHMVNLYQKELMVPKMLTALDKVSEIEHDRIKELQHVGRIPDEIKYRIYRNIIWFVQETVVVPELKTGCSYDQFSENMSFKHGTGIMEFVRVGIETGKISSSVKRHKKRNSIFVNHLKKNIKHDQPYWKVLVTTVFLNDVLNENVWTTFDSYDGSIILVKPSYAAVSYDAIRQIVIYGCLLNNALLNSITQRENKSSVDHQQENQIFQKLRNEK